MYAKANWKNFAEDMQQVAEDIASKAHSTSVNNLWSAFKTGIEKGVQLHIPQKNGSGRSFLPWITNKIRRLIKRRDRLNKKCKALRKRLHGFVPYELEDKIMCLKNQIQAESRRAYWSHVESLFTPGDDDNEYEGMKRFWRFVKYNRTDSSGIPVLKADGSSISDPTAKANILNDQFKKVFTKETPIPSDLLPDSSPHDDMPDIEITTEGIEKMLKNLKAHKAPGPDGITSRVMKTLANTIAPILCVIFRRSYETGEVPDDWRDANVVPIHKKGDKTDPGNYRPISLTCIACKLMEHIIASNIMTHGDDNNILYPLQHGFRQKRSCELQLLGFISDLTNNMEENKQTDVLITDFSKAFDKVGHGRLLQKLHYYGIRGRSNRWIANFLRNRRQRVVLDGSQSDEVEVDSGVPQGSVLGPCLFLYYINDLPNKMSSTVRLFADDAIMYLTIRTQQDTVELQDDLHALCNWASDWKMELNSQKCQVITVTRKRTRIQHQYRMNGAVLDSVTSTKYLGITITQDLKWNRHIASICQKANNTLSFLRRNLKINSPALKTMAYKALVRPLVEYGSAVWDPSTQRCINQLEMVQRRAARFVLHRYHNTSSVGDMIKQLEWPSLQTRREHSRLAFFYKIHNKLVDFNVTGHITPVTRPTRTVHSHGYHVPQSRTEQHRQSYFPRTVRTWNSLPQDVVIAPSADAFRLRLMKCCHSG